MKFKNKKELIAFICLNVFGAPFTWIAAYVLLSWYGVVGCIIMFYLCYKLWKHFGKNYDAKLSINPGFSFGNKKWHLL